MQAPFPQAMTADAPLDSIPGVVIRQDMQVGEAILSSMGIPWESANKYTVSRLPDGRRAIKVHNEPGGWTPTHEELKTLPPMMRAIEESNACTRVCFMFLGCSNMRPLKLHYYGSDNAERFTAIRPFKCGAFWCNPLETRLQDAGGKELGLALEDWSWCADTCWKAFCQCIFQTKVVNTSRGEPEHTYTLVTPMACCGRVSNCCGATCCKPNLIIDVQDAKGELVATIQKTYGSGGGCSAFCRCLFEADNFIVEFPANASATDRALLINALFHIEYQLFERSGDDDK